MKFQIKKLNPTNQINFQFVFNYKMFGLYNLYKTFQNKPQTISYDGKKLETCILISTAVNHKNSKEFLFKQSTTQQLEFDEIKVSKEKKTKMMICINSKEKKIFVTFKASLTVSELLKDIHYYNIPSENSGSIHAGILDLTNEFPLRIFQNLLQLHFEIIFTGFSFGSCIACLCCSRLLFLSSISEQDKKLISFVGFGCPLFVDLPFCKLIQEKQLDSHFFFFQNEGDVIPFVIPYLGYYHQKKQEMNEKLLNFDLFYFVEENLGESEVDAFKDVLENLQVFLVMNWDTIHDPNFPKYGVFGNFVKISETETKMEKINELPSKNEMDWSFDMKHDVYHYMLAVDKQINPNKKPKTFQVKELKSKEEIIPSRMEDQYEFMCQSIHFDSEIEIILKVKSNFCLYFKEIKESNCKILNEKVENNAKIHDEYSANFVFSIDKLPNVLEISLDGVFSDYTINIDKQAIIECDDLLGRQRKIAELTLPDLHLYSFSYSLFNERYDFGNESSKRREFSLKTLCQIADYYQINEKTKLPDTLVERVNQMLKELNSEEGNFSNNSQIKVKDLSWIHREFQENQNYSYIQALKDAFPTLALFELKAGKEKIDLDYNSFEKGLLTMSVAGTLILLGMSPITLIMGGIASMTLFGSAIGMGSLSIISNVILSYTLKKTIDEEYYNRLQLISLSLGIESKPIPYFYEKEISSYYVNHFMGKEKEIISNWKAYFLKEPLSLVLDEKSKIYSFNCIKHIYQNFQLRENLIQDYSIGIIGTGKSGKSTLAKIMHPNYETNPSQNIRTSEYDIYPFPIHERASLIDFPHLTSLNKNIIGSFYAYYKMLDAVLIILRSDQNLDSQDDYNIIKYVLQIHQLDISNGKKPIEFLICLNKFDEQLTSSFNHRSLEIEFNKEKEREALMKLKNDHFEKSLSTLFKKLKNDKFFISKELVEKLRKNLWLTSFDVAKDLLYCKEFKNIDGMIFENPNVGKKNTQLEFNSIGVKSSQDVKEWIDKFILKK
jgi:hypothetical protein